MKPFRSFVSAYTVLFLVVAALMLLPFAVRGVSLVWRADGLSQHFPALLYLGEWLRQTAASLLAGQPAVKLWDFGLGYGADVLTTLNYYVLGDPITLLSALVPQRYGEWLYAFLIMLRLYLSGLFFALYCRHFGRDGAGVLAGAIVYAFCGYALYAAVRHPYFANPMMYLPLLLLGAERIFDRKGPALFVAMVAVAAVSNFYFLYMLAAVVVGYCLVRYLMLRRGAGAGAFFREVGRFAALGALGAAMAAAVLVPVVLLFLGTDRAGEQILFDPLYGLGYYKHIAVGFVDASAKDTWSVMGFSAPALVAVLALLASPRRHFWLKLSLLAMTALFLVPAAGWALNGFSYVSNRWCWAYAFLVSVILAWMWPELFALGRGQKAAICAALAAYGLFAFVAVRPHAPAVLCSLAVAALELAAFSGRLPRWLKREGTARPGVLMSLVALGVAVNALFLYTPAGDDYTKSFVKAGTLYSRTVDTPVAAVAGLMAEDGAFSRCERTSFPSMNLGCLQGVSSTEYYWSLLGQDVSRFRYDLATNIGNTMDFHIYGLNGKTYLTTLAGVRYYLCDDVRALPYGYEKVQDEAASGSWDIYENTRALPLGYTYDSCLDRGDWDSMDAMQRQEAMMSAALVEAAPDGLPVARASADDLEFAARDIGYCVECGEGAGLMEDGSVAVAAQGGATVTLRFEGLERSEAYLFIQGLDAQWCSPGDVVLDGQGGAALREGQDSLGSRHSQNTFRIGVSSPNKARDIVYTTPYERNYAGWRDYLVNLGYTEEAQDQVTLSFPKPGVYRLDALRVLCLPMDRYDMLVDALSQDALADEHVGVNSVSGRIAVDRPKLLCLGVPYSEGWSATVDGQPAPLLKVNDMYCGLALQPGDHRVELSYFTPGLAAGLAVSAAGWIAFAALLLWRLWKRKEG